MNSILKYSLLKINALYSVFVIGLFLLVFFIPRENTIMLLAVYGVSFISFLLLYKIQVKNLFALGFTVRLMVIIAIPTLSDDYFRFLWDGALVGNGMSPFMYLPSEVYGYLCSLNSEVFIKELYGNMNSQPYYSVYPPINQWVFWLVSSFSSIQWGVVMLKFVVLAAELGVYWVLKKLTIRYSVNKNQLALYWLNPLIIIEMCGNAHLDNLMVMFFLLSTYSFAKLKDVEGSVYFAFGVLSKVFSLMFFPLILSKLPLKRSLKVLLLGVGIIIVCYFPFVNIAGLRNMGSSFDLYFRKFEFNASIYYLARYLGTIIMGYNPIAVIGPCLAIISTTSILFVSYLYRFRNRLAMYTGFLLINTLYLLFSPIVHPWYLSMLIALSVLSKYKFVLAWSGVVFISYWAYGNANFKENVLLLFVEYAVVFTFLFIDIKKHFSLKKIKAGLGIYS